MTYEPSVVSHERGTRHQAMQYPGTVENMLTTHTVCTPRTCGRLALLLEICLENQMLGNPGWDFPMARVAAVRLVV
ncbi:hypothetical protein [Nocardia sp. NBC_00511]|uniref:hypothetical protein n=1 Tax=Nocardia sp. NBC_00511 TaxID=2903591 RepID=UPI0030E2E5CF